MILPSDFSSQNNTYTEIIELTGQWESVEEHLRSPLVGNYAHRRPIALL